MLFITKLVFKVWKTAYFNCSEDICVSSFL